MTRVDAFVTWVAGRASVEPTSADSILLVLAAAVALAIAAVGWLAAVSLTAYSPTKLARVLGAESDHPALAHLEARDDDYQLLARSLGVLGLCTATLCTWHGAVTWRPLALVLLALIALLTCGVVPLRLTATRAEHSVLWTTGALRPLLGVLHYPLIVPLRVLGRAVVRVLRVPAEAPQDADGIADEIAVAVSDSVQESSLRDEEREWIENIVDLKDRHASEIMTPRTDVVAFERSTRLVDAVRLAADAGFSRFPVYEDRVDNVVGVFYAKDVLPLLGHDASETLAVGERVRQPLFVPEGMSVVELLRRFRASKVQMAIVLDEYGGTAGVVSIEDVLEEIVGDISDEYDEVDEEPIQVIEAGRVIEITGRARVDEANEILGPHIPEGVDYDTVAGYVFSTLDRIPKVDETVPVNGVEIRILGADDRRISRMRVTVVSP